MAGLIGKKVGMTSFFDASGKNIPCTVLQAGPCVVTQIKTQDNDGYVALQLAYGDKKEAKTPKALMGHFAKAKSSPKQKVSEFKNFVTDNKTIGDVLDVSIFVEGDFVDIAGVSKGKGFQGVVKRHGFSGVGGQTHGQHNRLRAPGSLGASSYPSKVMKGMRMAGQTGNKNVKAMNLSVVKVVPENNLLIVKGSVPGPNGSFVKIEKWS